MSHINTHGNQMGSEILVAHVHIPQVLLFMFGNSGSRWELRYLDTSVGMLVAALRAVFCKNLGTGQGYELHILTCTHFTY